MSKSGGLFRAKKIAIILARQNSKRLRNKHLILVKGKPLIQYTFEYAKDSPELDYVVCSTDSRDIADLAIQNGIEVIRRPAKFASDSSHIIDALEFTLTAFSEQRGFLPETTVILYGNVPHRASSIRQGLAFFYKKKADSVFTARHVLKYHPEWTFKKDSSSQIIFEKKSLNYNFQDLPDYYLATDSFIISKTKSLMRRRPRTHLYSDFGDKICFLVEKKLETVDVDTRQDLEMFHFLLEKNEKKGKEITYWKNPLHDESTDI